MNRDDAAARADLMATLREIIALSNQALKVQSMSGSTLRAVALQQIRDRASVAVDLNHMGDSTDGNTRT